MTCLQKTYSMYLFNNFESMNSSLLQFLIPKVISAYKMVEPLLKSATLQVIFIHTSFDVTYNIHVSILWISKNFWNVLAAFEMLGGHFIASRIYCSALINHMHWLEKHFPCKCWVNANKLLSSHYTFILYWCKFLIFLEVLPVIGLM